MNEVFLIGRIVTEIEFEFMINSRHISIAMFEIELSNKSIIRVKAYDDIADYAYSKLKRSDIVFINGKIGTEGTIHIKYICYWKMTK